MTTVWLSPTRALPEAWAEEVLVAGSHWTYWVPVAVSVAVGFMAWDFDIGESVVPLPVAKENAVGSGPPIG